MSIGQRLKKAREERNVTLEDVARQRVRILARCQPATAADDRRTGERTGRSAKDKFVVVEPDSESRIWWDKNAKMNPAEFATLVADVREHLNGQELFVQDLYAGADAEYRLPVRFIQEFAWQNLFVRNLFIVPPAGDLAESIRERNCSSAL